MTNPAGIALKCLPLRDMDFVDGFVSFRTLCGMQSSPLGFASNYRFECGPLPRQTPGGPRLSGLS